MMKRITMWAMALAFLTATGMATADEFPWKRKPQEPDKSLGAVVSQVIGGTSMITIKYHRPGVKGRNVWEGSSDNPQVGPLVPRDEDPRAWRAGANEATIVEVSDDVLVEGEPLPAGDYALFLVPGDESWQVVFNSQATQWGSFRHDKSKDVLRVTVTPEEAPHQEWLAYGFDQLDGYSARAYLHWEKKKVPFTIELADKGE